jgi:hypothetical protein
MMGSPGMPGRKTDRNPIRRSKRTNRDSRKKAARATGIQRLSKWQQKSSKFREEQFRTSSSDLNGILRHDASAGELVNNGPLSSLPWFST